MRRAIGLFMMLLSPLLCQELSLDRYLDRLKTAPGLTIEDKVRSLSSVGVSLSAQGLRELREAASLPATGSWQSYTPSRTPLQTWTAPRSTFSNDYNPMESYTVRQRPFGGASVQNDLDPLDSYTIRPRSFGGSHTQHDFNPLESYTTRRGFGGRVTTTHDFDPMQSWTGRPTFGGGYKIQSDLNPMDSYTVRPLPGGRGVRVENDFAPLDSYTVRRR